MNRIIKIGMDVHSTNYTLCAMEPIIGAEDRIFGEVQVAPEYKAAICFIESLKTKFDFTDDLCSFLGAGSWRAFQFKKREPSRHFQSRKYSSALSADRGRKRHLQRCHRA